MAIIKCYECGKDISDLADSCIGCGAPTKIPKADISAGFDSKGAKSFFRNIMYSTSKALDSVVDYGKDVMASQEEKDARALDNLSKNPINDNHALKTQAEIDCEAFKAALESTIDVKVAETLSAKEGSEHYLNYVDAQIITASVRNVFKRILSFTPAQVDASCALAEAILAPSMRQKKNLIKSSVGMAGGAAGIVSVIAGIGMALGWGASMIAGVTAVFAGSSVAGPMGWVVGGLTLAAIAGYFATTSDNHTDTERFIKVLKGGCGKSVTVIWDEHGEQLSTSLRTNQPVA